MAEKLEDLNLPNQTVQKIIKEALPESVTVGRDARSALSRAASVFVLYITSQASKEAHKVNRKTLVGQDVLDALGELEFEDFIEPLQELLKEHKHSKQKKAKKKSNDGEAEQIDADVDGNEEDEDEQDDST